MVLGNRGNIKITKPEDVYILKGLLEYRHNEEILGVSFLDTKNEAQK
jgi:2-C-methyl-D-erythritol 4-phosphate cytidylyltransferase